MKKTKRAVVIILTLQMKTLQLGKDEWQTRNEDFGLYISITPDYGIQKLKQKHNSKVHVIFT